MSSHDDDVLTSLRLLADQGAWGQLEAKARKELGKHSNQTELLELLAYSLQQQGRLEGAVVAAAY